MAAVDRTRRRRRSAPSRSSHRRRSGPAIGRGRRAPAPGPPGDAVAAARQPGTGRRPRTCATRPWFRLDPVLDGEGALRGAAAGARARRWSHRAGRRICRRSRSRPDRSGGIVLVGSDDGAGSRLVAFDVAGGCAWPLATERDVIRRATDRSGRCVDLRDARRSSQPRRPRGLAAAARRRGRPRRILEPLPADDRFGRTFSTEFTWDVAGDRLAVQACGEVACRTRIIDPATARPRATSTTPDSASSSGSTAIALVTYGACRGLPCPIVSTDLRTGARLDARRRRRTGGRRRRRPTAPGSCTRPPRGDGPRLRSIALDGAAAVRPRSRPRRARPGSRPAAARLPRPRLPAGWVLLAPDGRVSPTRPAVRPQLRRIPDGMTVPFDEAMR